MDTDGQDQKKAQEQDKEVKAKRKAAKYLVYELAMEFGFLIAIPLIIFTYLGKWLDGRYNTKFFALIGIFLALTVSVISISRRIKEIRERLK